MNMKDGQLSRLNGFRTTLISFKVHRIYLFSKNQTGRGAAHDAEQQLHDALDRNFNAKSVRMMHSDNRNATEWWKVEPKDVPPAYATKFLKTDAKVLKFEKPPDKRVRFVNGETVLVRDPISGCHLLRTLGKCGPRIRGFRGVDSDQIRSV